MCIGRKKSAPAPTTTTPTTTTTTTTATATPTTTTVDPLKTSDPDKPIGTTSEDKKQKQIEEQQAEQERLAAEQLRQERIKRARNKQKALAKRLERMQEVGAGKKVLTGQEKELAFKTPASLISPTARRGGMGRRSLVTGSTGGIGYYSRYL
tara:strand:- start:150 stop:605 length:456 start_codon:yes stop_codon:yes gene_type:complete